MDKPEPVAAPENEAHGICLKVAEPQKEPRQRQRKLQSMDLIHIMLRTQRNYCLIKMRVGLDKKIY